MRTKLPDKTDRREWAKIEAGYAHVNTMLDRADDKVNLLWHGWALREAFIVGAEWQESRSAAVTLNPDDERQVEAVKRAIWAVRSSHPKVRSMTYEELLEAVASNPASWDEEFQRLDRQARAVIEALKARR